MKTNQPLQSVHSHSQASSADVSENDKPSGSSLPHTEVGDRTGSPHAINERHLKHQACAAPVSGHGGYKNLDKRLIKAGESAMMAGDVSCERRDQAARALRQTTAPTSSMTTETAYKQIPERIFMNGLIKHTGIALAIIIPLAAFSAYAAPSTQPVTARVSIKPSAILHKSASTPTTVDRVDLNRYAGMWYEIGRLPMYFQRKCARDVTAHYSKKSANNTVIVTNKCVDKNGTKIVAEGLATPVDGTGSQLKVTFLPSWMRKLPVGQADYWVLARDGNYQTALVGTPDHDYLWLLARSPNLSQETYSKYRQIAQQQGYDLTQFKVTPHSNQTLHLTP